MTKEFNLSDRISFSNDKDGFVRFRNGLEDVKEFIRLLKEELITTKKTRRDYLVKIVDKLAGDKLK